MDKLTPTSPNILFTREVRYWWLRLKATLHLTVPADVACLAAGNPKGGRFDLYNGVTDRTLQRWRQDDDARTNSSKPPGGEEES